MRRNLLGLQFVVSSFHAGSRVEHYPVESKDNFHVTAARQWYYGFLKQLQELPVFCFFLYVCVFQAAADKRLIS